MNVSVSDLYVPRIGLPIWLQQNRQADPANIYKRGTFIHIRIQYIDECGNW